MHTGKEPLALAGTLAELEALGGAPKPDSQGGRLLAPHPRTDRVGLVARIARSTWAPLVGRSAAITSGLLLFAGIGIYSAQTRPGGVHVASQMAPDAPVSWLQPSEPEVPAPPAGSTPAPPKVARESSPALAGVIDVAPCSTPGTLCKKDEDKGPPPGLTEDGKVILNVAGVEILTRLPGVGARRAEAIVKLRERLKRFRRPTDLLRIRGIGVRSLKRMLPHLVLDPPAPPKPDGEKKQPAQADAPN